MGWREWSRRRAVRIGALTALLGVVVVLQAFTREWTGEWQARKGSSGYARLALANSGWPAEGELFFFTSSMNPNFLFVGNGVPGDTRPGPLGRGPGVGEGRRDRVGGRG